MFNLCFMQQCFLESEYFFNKVFRHTYHLVVTRYVNLLVNLSKPFAVSDMTYVAKRIDLDVEVNFR